MKTQSKIISLIALSIFISILISPVFSIAQTTKGGVVGTEKEVKEGNIHGLVIGISDYDTYSDLNYADKDALFFYKLLISDALGADSNRVTLLLNQQATVNRVEEALSNLVNFVEEGDQVYIYFSGHGIVKSMQKASWGFLLTWEANETNLKLTTYRIDDLLRYIVELANANKAEVFVILDACHSGHIQDETTDQVTMMSFNDLFGKVDYGTWLLSCSSDEISLEGSQWGGGRGLFSYHLVEGLAGKADDDGNMFVDLNELSYYVKKQVKSQALPNKQTPVMANDDKVISAVSTKFLAMLEESNPSMLMASVEKQGSKGYENFYIEQLSPSQREIYDKLIASMNKTNCLGLSCINFTKSMQYFDELLATGIDENLEAILRRKLIASLQDKPQAVFNIILSGETATSYEGETCLMAKNLKYSAELMGKDHYLYSITMAKSYFFKSYCFKFNSHYKDDKSIMLSCLEATDSALFFANDISLFYFTKANVLSDLGRDREAIEFYDKAIELDPTDASCFHNKGVSQYSLGLYEEAIASYDQAIALKPNDPVTYKVKANSLRALERYEEALLMCQKAIELDPEYASGYNVMGIVLDDLLRFEEAIEYYDKAIALDPSDAYVYYNKAISYKNLEDYESAIIWYEKAIEVNPDDEDFYSGKANCLRELGRLEEALKMYDIAIDINSENPNIHKNRGIVLDDLGLYPQALRAYNKAIQLNSTDETYYLYKAITLVNMEDYEGAIEMYDLAIKLNPELYLTYRMKGNALRNLERYAEAVDNFRMAVKLNPTDYSSYNSLGIVLDDLGKYEEALEMYDMAIKLDPKNAIYYNNKGVSLRNLDRHEEAVAMYSKAVELNSEYLMAYFNKGYSLMLIGQHKEAIKCYEKCIELDPEDPASYFYNMGCAYSLMDNKKKAVQYLELALSSGYNRFEWIEQDTDWDNVRNTPEFKAVIEKYKK